LPLDDRQVQADTRSHLTHEFVDRNADIALVSDRAVNVTGKVREVASSVDPAAGTVRVKIGTERPRPAMTLGAVITRTGRLKQRKRIILPWSTLASQDGKPAVWVVDPHGRAVALPRVTIDAYQTGEIILRPDRDRFAKLLCRTPPPLANACFAQVWCPASVPRRRCRNPLNRRAARGFGPKLSVEINRRRKASFATQSAPKKRT